MINNKTIIKYITKPVHDAYIGRLAKDVLMLTEQVELYPYSVKHPSRQQYLSLRPVNLPKLSTKCVQLYRRTSPTVRKLPICSQNNNVTDYF